MTTRGAQTLIYDEENQLASVSGGGGPTVTFGYAEGGARLWRNSSSSGLTVWIGDLYEERAGRILCHVFAGGRRISTFEPQGGFFCEALPAETVDRRRRQDAGHALVWPLQEGRTPVSVLICDSCGILGGSIVARRSCLTRRFSLHAQRSTRVRSGSKPSPSG